MQYFPATEGGAMARLTGRTLVVPAVGAGNVGQLAADLLINTLKLPRVGYAEEPHVLPCVGCAPYAHATGGTLATPLELYAADGAGPVVLQMRSPAAPGTQRAFATNVAQWAGAMGFTDVLMLCSLAAQWRTEARVGLGLQLGCLSTPTAHPRCEQLGWAVLTDDEFSSAARRDAVCTPWPTFEALGDAHVPTTALVAFVTEGDNIPEAAQVAQRAAEWLRLEGMQWTMPPSWAHLYGPPPEMSLY